MDNEKIIIGDLLTIEDKKYITLEILTYENEEYIFVNEMIEEEPTENFYIFKKINDGVRMIIEENLKSILIPKFQELLEKDIKEMLN